MKGVVLAGGTGTRLLPMTATANKHLLDVQGVPMIWHGLWKLRQAGIREVAVVTGPEHAGPMGAALDGIRPALDRVPLLIQEEPAGIAHALALAEDFASGSELCVLLGDNLFEDELTAHATAFRGQGSGARIHLKRVEDPRAYGVAVVEEGRVARLVEKPAAPPSPLAVTGIYFYDASVFQRMRRLAPSHRGEFEITDVNHAYLDSGELDFGMLAGAWVDAGTLPHLEEARRMQLPRPFPGLED